MKLTEIVDLQLDDYVGHTYGQTNQLKVIGWDGRQPDSAGKGKKLYVSFCSVCYLDPELFEDGIFKCSKSAISAGQIPCGCSKKPTWSESQLKVRVRRKAEERGYRFHGFAEQYNKALTKLVLECSLHGKWDTMQANNFLFGQSCPGCSIETRVSKLTTFNTYEDDQFIESFLNTGLYPLDTVFTRSNRLSGRGLPEYWNYFCYECCSPVETTAHHIREGRKACECSKFNPKQAYIKLLESDGLPVAIKYGIANTAANRVHRNCTYKVHNHSFWQFPDRDSCIKAEAKCDNSLVTRVVDKANMPDGYTETTYIESLDTIISIYRDYGGTVIKEFTNVFGT